jgi:hypothetical protein
MTNSTSFFPQNIFTWCHFSPQTNLWKYATLSFPFPSGLPLEDITNPYIASSKA